MSEVGKNYAVNPTVRDTVLACYGIVLRYNGTLSETAAALRAEFPAVFTETEEIENGA